MRKPLLLAVSLLAGTAACTSLLGDFSLGAGGTDGGSSSGSTQEGGSDGPAPGDDGGGNDADAGGETGPTVTSVPVGGSVYLGQKATLDGTKSTPSSTNGGQYAWALGQVPTGSGIKQGNINNATTATPSFTPDVLGEYDFTLKVTDTASGQSVSNSTKVFAVTPQIFFARGAVTDAGASAAYTVIDYDGGNAHPVVCPDTVVTSVPNEIATFAAYAGRAFDFWEAPAGQPSRLAGFMVDYTAGVGYSTHLYTTTSTTTCDGGGATALTGTFGPGTPYGSTPRFSPDGSRFAVYDKKWNIVTYPSTGTQPVNTVAQYPLSFGQPGLDPTGASGLNGYVQEPPRVEWVGRQAADGGQVYSVAWAAPMPIGGGVIGWGIVTAADAAFATPTTYMTCAGVLPRRFAILGDGSVVASYRQSTSGPEDLVHLNVNAGQCQVITNYTNLSNNAGAVATDFDISPDGKTIAYLAIDPTAQDASALMTGSSQLPGGHVFTVPVVGGSSSAVSVDLAVYGPRWIGAGGWLVYTRLDGVKGTQPVGSGGTLATSIVVKPFQGGGQSVVTTGDGVNTFASTSGSGACSAARGAGAGQSAWAAGAGLGGLIALAGIVRVRRRRLR